ncbi:MAG: hypothetical protein RPU42_04150 [Candidatus Sedimenticola sp. (ex Thyasira tokunagai)]
MAIPEKKDSSKQKKERKFMTGLPALSYVDFEREALERGVSAFDLSRSILLNWMESEGYHPSSSAAVAGAD